MPDGKLFTCVLSNCHVDEKVVWPVEEEDPDLIDWKCIFHLCAKHRMEWNLWKCGLSRQKKPVRLHYWLQHHVLRDFVKNDLKRTGALWNYDARYKTIKDYIKR